MTRSRYSLFVLCSAAATFAWVVTSGGSHALNCVGIDWADHLGYVETFFLDRNSEVAAAVKSNMGHYPPLAHWLCAFLSRCCDFPPPRTLQLFSAALGFVGCALVANRAWRLITIGYQTPGTRLLASLIVSGIFGALTFLGLGLFGHLAFNFFYAQFCGTAAALVGLEVLRHRRLQNLYLSSVFLHLVGATLTCIHLLPALWFYAAALLTGMLLARGPRVATTYLMANGAIVAFSLWFNPYAQLMVRDTANNDGDFVMRTGVFTSRPILTVILFSSVALVLLLTLSAWRRLGRDSWTALIRHHAGLLSIVGLLFLNSMVFLTLGQSSWYTLKKYLMILAIECPLGLFSLFAFLASSRANWLASYDVARSDTTSLRRSRSFALTIVAYGLLVAAQVSFGRWGYDQLPLLYYREVLLSQRYDQRNPTERAYPQSPRLHSIANYYLATGILGIPRDGRTLRWLVEKQGQGEVDLPLHNPTLPRAWYWHTVKLGASPATDPQNKLKIAVHWPYAQHFLLAKALPTQPEEVSVGVRKLDAQGRLIAEDRAILTRRYWYDNENFIAVVRTSANLPDVAQLSIDLVQEGVVWFGERAPGDSSVLAMKLPLRESRSPTADRSQVKAAASP
jgi:hypothetical protein